MASVAEMISHIRLKLGDPLPEKPRDEVITQFLKDSAQQFYNELANTASNWTVKKQNITVNAGQDTYLLPFPDFSQELMMRTVDPTDPQHWQREVMICQLQNIEQFFHGPLTDQFTASKHSAQTASFYMQDGSVYVQIRPIPARSADYEIWYIPGPFRVQDFGQSIGFEQFHPMLENKVALAVADLCRWQGMDGEMTIAMIEGRKAALQAEYELQKDTFDHYKMSMAIPQIEDRILYGQENEDAMGFGGPNVWYG
jgi:hypothetical protein